MLEDDVSQCFRTMSGEDVDRYMKILPQLISYHYNDFILP